VNLACQDSNYVNSPNIHYNPAVQTRSFGIFLFLGPFFLSLFASAQASEQTQTQSAAHAEQNPPVQINYLNVCTPSDSEKDEIAATLALVPNPPKLVTDFEIARGQSSLENAESARYVRLRREFPADSKFSTVQYSISNNGRNTTETLVLTARDVRELRQISIEDSISSGVASVNALLSVDTPASRIKVERFGKSSVGLSRCQGADQSKYEPIFFKASSLASSYRRSLSLRSTLSAELKWLAASSSEASTSTRRKKAPAEHK
jgi:hypothetical protein